MSKIESQESQFRRRQLNETISKSWAFHNPLAGGIPLQQCLGIQKSIGPDYIDTGSAVWAGNLDQRAVSSAKIDKFVHLPLENSYFYATVPVGTDSDTYVEIRKEARYDVDFPDTLNAQISSMSFAQDSGFILTTNLGNRGEIKVYSALGTTGMVDSTKTRNLYRCSAAKPSSGIFALGHDGGMDTLWLHPDDYWEISRSPLAESSTQAVDWLDRNILIGGLRNGKVRMWDTRASGTNHSSFSHVIKHGSCITHVRAWNQNQIVVAGIEDQLNTYDLRYVLPGPNLEHAASEPYMRFPNYKNKAHTCEAIGFDICPTLNLIATATDDERVLLFNAGTGEQLESRASDHNYPLRKLPTAFKCIRFVHHGWTSRRSPKIAVATLEGLKEWTWAKQRPVDSVSDTPSDDTFSSSEC